MSRLEKRQQEKKVLFEELMKHDHVLVHLDSKKEGVSVPKHLANNPSLALKLSYHFQGTTSVDDEAVTAQLKFQAEYFSCVLPWEAIWGLTGSNGEKAIWPEDMPLELLAELAREQLKLFGKKLLGRGAKKNADDEADTVASDKQAKGKSEKKRGVHLKRVK